VWTVLPLLFGWWRLLRRDVGQSTAGARAQ
jgi:hypothetical protein